MPSMIAAPMIMPTSPAPGATPGGWACDAAATGGARAELAAKVLAQGGAERWIKMRVVEQQLVGTRRVDGFRRRGRRAGRRGRREDDGKRGGCDGTGSGTAEANACGGGRERASS